MVRLYTTLLCFSDPCYYFKLKTLQPVSLPFLLFNKIHEFQALFCKTTQACPGFQHGYTSFRASAFFSCRSTVFCRLQNRAVRHNWLIKIETKPSLLCPTLLCGEFCGRNRWIQPFFVYSAILCFALPCTSCKRCGQSHQAVVDRWQRYGGLFAEPGHCLPSSYHPRLWPADSCRLERYEPGAKAGQVREGGARNGDNSPGTQGWQAAKDLLAHFNVGSLCDEIKQNIDERIKESPFDDKLHQRHNPKAVSQRSHFENKDARSTLKDSSPS